MMKFPVAMRTLAAGAALTAGLAMPVLAQQREVLEWTGLVDHEVQITLRGRTATTSLLGPGETGRNRANVTNTMPRTEGEVTVRVLNGRGAVDVIQQPSAANNYTTIIRISDNVSGADRYRINAYWQPSSAGEVGPPYGRARGRNRDVYDRNNGVYGNGNRSVYGNAIGNRIALRWSGDVDDDLNIRIRPSGVEYATLSGKVPRRVTSNLSGIPQTGAQVGIANLSGRGSVEVIQQPSSANGYTAVIRIRDPQSGYGTYSFNLVW
jgi:hypothetical protein